MRGNACETFCGDESEYEHCDVVMVRMLGHDTISVKSDHESFSDNTNEILR